MRREPIICLVTRQPDPSPDSLEQLLRERYFEGYRIVVTLTDEYADSALRAYREHGEQIALFIYEQHGAEADGALFLERASASFPDARKVLAATNTDLVLAIHQDAVDEILLSPLTPPETRLYPVLDELLAEWRASVELPFMSVKGIMTVRAVRIRIDDSLHRAAEVIALSGIGDLMVIDEDNNFVGVLSVGDVLRAAMPDIGEITGEGGTMEQAFRLFLRKGSELMYKPISPLVIRNPLVVDPDDHVAKAATLMIEKNIHRLPVVRDGRLVGTVGRTDICQAVVGTL